MNPKNFFKNNLFAFIISVAFMIAFCVIAMLFNVKAGIMSCVLLLCYLLYVFIYLYFGSGDVKNNLAGKSLASHTFDFISGCDVPVLLCDIGGVVSWYNEKVKSLYNDEIKIGTQCKTIGSGEIDVQKFAEMRKNGTEYTTVKIGKEYFRISPYLIETMRKSFYLVVWMNTTEYEDLYKEYLDSNTIVAYAAIDNITELASGMQQDRYREISAKISGVLNEWVSSMNGVIKEYERDKYIILLEERHLQKQLDAKFDILDKVYDVSATDEGVPLTVSIGLSRIDGTLSEKDEAAKNSLQLALQRGGAQAVVKTRTENEFFGGKTKTIQKRTKIKSRVVATQLVSLIRKASNIIIMGHSNPDFDSLASGVGIARLAMWLGKNVKMVTDLENQNFDMCSSRLLPLKEYDDMFIDKVYGQELLTPETLVVITDVSNEKIFESPEIYRKAEHIVLIDHHRQIQEFDKKHDITYIEPTASSASEIVSEMLEIVLPPNTICKEEAELMLAGILLDTQNFVRSVGIRTFSAATYLRGEGASTMRAQSMFKYKLGEFKKLAEFEKNIFVFRKIFAITQYDSDNMPENRITASQAAERMLQIEGIRASFTLSIVDDSIHISARSDGSVNVSLILELLHGGGHFDSAGAKLTGVTMKQAMTMLRDAIVKYCEEE